MAKNKPNRPLNQSFQKGCARLRYTTFDNISYTKAEPLYQEAFRIWQKVLGPKNLYTATSLENLALLEFDLGRIDVVTALARQASAAQLTILSKILSLTSEQQRLAYLYNTMRHTRVETLLRP